MSEHERLIMELLQVMEGMSPAMLNKARIQLIERAGEDGSCGRYIDFINKATDFAINRELHKQTA